MNINSSLIELKGVGEALYQKFAALGIKTIADLVDYYPRRYEDYSQVSPVAQLQPGAVTIEAQIKQVAGRYVRRGMHVTEAIASDKTASVRLVWFNQPYRAAALKSGQSYLISGQYERSHQRFVIMNPSVELSSELPINVARILPVYRETKGLTSRQIRSLFQQIQPLFAAIPETLPADIVQNHRLLSRSEALHGLHLPANNDDLLNARRRLGFEEVFQLSLASLLNKQVNQSETALSIPFQADLAKRFVKHLPFDLTDDQRKVVWQIYQDLQKPQPMNRLLEGDVGSGKTVVAAMAGLMAIDQGWQVALMAPTELLARQHADTIHRLYKALGHADKVDLLVGSLTPKQKAQAWSAIKTGRAGFIVGTQALIQEQVDMHKLALVIIDEQHRFGVEQRKTLMQKAGHMPHVLSLTATPIPRSLALTLYGEMDVSILAEKPAGRQPITTIIVSPNSRQPVYARLTELLKAGQQIFVVCPLISESDITDSASAEATYEQLSNHEFKNWRVGLLHGKLKADQKQMVMDQFVHHEIDILVSTTVIEVGVDVPNASVMLIEAAERFGLAQLHQLRGRVGRGQQQAYCYLMLSDSKAVSKRLRALATSNDGFRLAELDLELRGPGAIYGTLQHGALDLRIAKLSDTKLIAEARTAAQQLLDQRVDLLQYKQLMAQVTKLRAVTNLN